MDKLKILSGEELVARGVTKKRAVLPELGLKDVFPNKSWIEQKQVQTSLDARKQLIQVERIEKSSSLSRAEWNEELMLAEVSRKAGGHWQYFGHNVGKQLYLLPEEALFLMEMNALLLTYNGVTVSLQQAYSLLLRSKISHTQYKVYASLCRVGYKVFRHKPDMNNPQKIIQLDKTNGIEKKGDKTNGIEKGDKNTGTEIDMREVGKGGEEDMEISSNILDNTSNSNGSLTDPKVNSEGKNTSDKCENAAEKCENMEVDNIKTKSDPCADVQDGCDKNPFVSNAVEPNTGCDEMNVKVDTNSKGIDMPTVNPKSKTSTENTHENTENVDMETQEQNITEVTTITKLEKLKARQLKSSNPKYIEKYFQIIPDFYQKQVVPICIPKENCIPKNVFLNKITYVLNVESMTSNNKSKITGKSNDSMNYLDQVYSSDVQRVRDVEKIRPPVVQNNGAPAFNTLPVNNQPSPLLSRPVRHQFYRPQANINLLQWNWFMNFMPRMPYNRLMLNRPPLLATPNIRNANPNTSSATNETYNSSSQSTRKRTQVSFKHTHMEAIKRLAERLKHIIESGVTQTENVIALHRLISTYNIRYKTNLKLTEDFAIYNDEKIMDMIEVYDDEETVRKRRKLAFDAGYKDNLAQMKKLAEDLKELSSQGLATARHRRVMSSLIKKFNQSYDVDICLKNNEIFVNSPIALDSSSESDCVVEEPTRQMETGKKLKNPFNILKRRSKKSKNLSGNIPNNAASEFSTAATSTIPASTGELSSNVSQNNVTNAVKTIVGSSEKEKVFGKWLPERGDFCQPEVPSKSSIYSFLVDMKIDEYMFEFIKTHPGDYKDWLDFKICYLEMVGAARCVIASNIQSLQSDECSVRPIIGPKSSHETSSVLEKLRIIKSFTDDNYETNLKIDFDVYNRDVQNFKKTRRPKPHFRVICMSESSPFPSGRDVAALHSSYADDVTIIFAAVGHGSVSFLQINPSDLPVYVPQRKSS